MKHILSQTALPVIAGIAVLGMSLPVSALAYKDLQIEVYFDDGRIEVDVDYYENGREIEREFVFNTTDLDEAYELTAEELDISVAEVEDAVVRVDRDDDDDSDDDDYDDDRDDDDRQDDDRKDASYYRNSTRTDASEAIRDAKEEIAEAERFVARNTSNEKAAADLREAKRLLADAEEAFQDGTFGTAERLGDQAEYLAEAIVAGRSTNMDTPTKTPTNAPGSSNAAQMQQLIALLQQLIALLQAQR